MCLLSKWAFPRRAKEDIVCYKVLTNNYYFIRGWVTPFTVTPVKFNQLLIASPQPTFAFLNPHMKGEGYIHAFTKQKLVKDEYFLCHNDVFKAIIPKGTKYHIGENGCEICAKKMFITDEKVYDLH